MQRTEIENTSVQDARQNATHKHLIYTADLKTHVNKYFLWKKYLLGIQESIT